LQIKRFLPDPEILWRARKDCHSVPTGNFRGGTAGESMDKAAGVPENLS
jgi:hypothetical protein